MIKEKLKKLNLATPIAVIGAGITGKSCFDLLRVADLDCVVFDESNKLSKHFTDNADKVQLGKFTTDSFTNYGTILLSPGVDTRRDVFACNKGKLITDIELFARLTEKTLVGVTGSNGKSTVVSLLHDVCKQAKRNFVLCGNIGLPVLTALLDNEDNPQTEGYIIELSSYHLDNAPSLQLDIGVLLNISPDHLDRYDSYEDYIESKINVLRQAKWGIRNADDNAINRGMEKDIQKAKKEGKNITAYGLGGFSLKKPLDFFYKAPYILQNEYTYKNDDREKIDAKEKKVFNIKDYVQQGTHHIENLLAVFTIAEYLEIDPNDTATACKNFAPLPARTVLVAEHNGIQFINDSKATNVGAAVAAIQGFESVILIAGGQGKGQDFTDLADACTDRVKLALILGEDAEIVESHLNTTTQCKLVANMQQAVEVALQNATAGDTVLLSPACASWDMYASYIKRGEHFEQLVREQLVKERISGGLD